MKRQELMICLYRTGRPLAFSIWFAGLFVYTFLFTAPAVYGQESPLDDYLREGLTNNLSLQEQQFDVEKSFRAMDEARGLFFPEVSIEARYSRAGGGRQISFPVGDLLNPVYNTLNDMLSQQGELPIFPQLENQDIGFLRDREQESKIRLIQPLFQPAILHNYRLQQHLLGSQEAALDAYKQLLMRDIKVAYYNYLKAEKATGILDAARDLVDENLRVNERLVEYDKATQDAVYRARAEMLAVAQQQRESVKNKDLAQSYFNFLLNRPFEENIDQADEGLLMAAVEAPAARLIPASATVTTPSAQAAFTRLALQNRYELKQLEAAISASNAAVNISKSDLLPGVAFALDLGIQGSSYGFAGDQSFYMASVVFSWKLFNGFQNRNRIQQARIESQKLTTQHEALQQQIKLQVQEAFDNLEVARESYLTAQQRLTASSEGYRLVSRRYDEGMANQVTFLDARTTLTEAEINLNLTRYDVLIRMAELEYAVAVNQAPESANP